MAPLAALFASAAPAATAASAAAAPTAAGTAAGVAPQFSGLLAGQASLPGVTTQTPAFSGLLSGQSSLAGTTPQAQQFSGLLQGEANLGSGSPEPSSKAISSKPSTKGVGSAFQARPGVQASLLPIQARNAVTVQAPTPDLAALLQQLSQGGF